MQCFMGFAPAEKVRIPPLVSKGLTRVSVLNGRRAIFRRVDYDLILGSLVSPLCFAATFDDAWGEWRRVLIQFEVLVFCPVIFMCLSGDTGTC